MSRQTRATYTPSNYLTRSTTQRLQTTDKDNKTTTTATSEESTDPGVQKLTAESQEGEIIQGASQCPAARHCDAKNNTDDIGANIDGEENINDDENDAQIDIEATDDTSDSESDQESVENLTFGTEYDFLDDDMAGVALMPVHFHGLKAEDAEVWWRDVEHWCAFRKLTEEEKLGLIPLLLKDGARYWFDALPDNSKDTFVHIKESFQAQYKRDESNKWRDAAAVWSTSQGVNQSVEDYITTVQQKALRANLSEEQTRFCLINGLKQGIRQAVLQHEPTTIADIRKWAIISENSYGESAQTNIADMIKRLEEKVDKIQVAEIGSGSASRETRRSTSPRVTFSDESRERWSSPARSSGNGRPYQGTATTTDWRGTTQPATRETSWGRRNNDYGQTNQGGNYRNSTPQRQGQNNSFGNRRGNFRQNFSGRGITCYKCGLRGHYQSTCRGVRRASQQQ